MGRKEKRFSLSIRALGMRIATLFFLFPQPR